jgi:hypothetical protein
MSRQNTASGNRGDVTDVSEHIRVAQSFDYAQVKKRRAEPTARKAKSDLDRGDPSRDRIVRRIGLDFFSSKYCMLIAANVPVGRRSFIVIWQWITPMQECHNFIANVSHSREFHDGQEKNGL